MGLLPGRTRFRSSVGMNAASGSRLRAETDRRWYTTLRSESPVTEREFRNAMNFHSAVESQRVMPMILEQPTQSGRDLKARPDARSTLRANSLGPGSLRRCPHLSGAGERQKEVSLRDQILLPSDPFPPPVAPSLFALRSPTWLPTRHSEKMTLSPNQPIHDPKTRNVLLVGLTRMRP